MNRVAISTNRVVKSSLIREANEVITTTYFAMRDHPLLITVGTSANLEDKIVNCVLNLDQRYDVPLSINGKQST